ncbi:MAG: GntR family transcriptional regulator [Dehalobacterium sp.]
MPINKKIEPLYNSAYTQIKKDIMTGRYQPGERLTDKDLADQLGVSRTPIREALKQLIKEGLLSNEHNKGVSVFSPTLQDIAEIYVLRSSLEGIAAAICAGNERRKDYLYYMMEQLDISRKAQQEQDIEQLTESNMLFHDLLLKGSESERLKNLVEPLRSKSMLMRFSSLTHKQHSELSVIEHQQIFEMVRQGEIIKAENYMRKHILSAGDRLIKLIYEDELHRGNNDVWSTLGQNYRNYISLLLQEG